MSFSDLMQSARGPGVVGILLAMLVLGGFGLLFIFSFDDVKAEAKVTPEHAIHEQEKEINDLRVILGERQTGLEKLPRLQEAERKLRELTESSAAAAGNIEGAKAAIAETAAKIDGLQADLEAYKDLYRQASRIAAKGEQMDTLTTLANKTYRQIVVREVNAIGMRIAFDGGAGSTTIPFEQLPAELQDRFQFDAEQRDALLAQESGAVKIHQDQIDKKNKADETAKQLQELQEQKDRIANARRDLSLKKSQVIQLDADYQQLQADLSREMLKKLRNTNVIKQKLADNRARREQIQKEILALQVILTP